MTDIRRAYCFETSSFEPADHAVHKRDIQHQSHHYYCPTPACGHFVFPWHWHDTGVAFFHSKPITSTEHHSLGCPHNVGTALSSTSHKSKTSPINNQHKVVVPTVLGKSEANTTRAWPTNPPTKEQIALEISRAKNLRIFGTIEDVVNAYQTIKGERAEHGLEVNRKVGDYRRSFPWIWKLPRPWQPEDWLNNIVIVYCKVKLGNHRGLWFLNAIGGYNAPSRDEWPSLTLRYSDFSRLPEKKYLGSFLDAAAASKETVALFWQGPPPKQTDRGYMFISAQRPLGEALAIRTLPKQTPK